MARIEFDKQAIDQLVRNATAEVARRAQLDLDRLSGDARDRDLAQVLPALQTILRKHGLQTDNSQLESWAQSLTAGRRVLLQPAPV